MKWLVTRHHLSGSEFPRHPSSPHYGAISMNEQRVPNLNGRMKDVSCIVQLSIAECQQQTWPADLTRSGIVTSSTSSLFCPLVAPASYILVLLASIIEFTFRLALNHPGFALLIQYVLVLLHQPFSSPEFWMRSGLNSLTHELLTLSFCLMRKRMEWPLSAVSKIALLFLRTTRRLTPEPFFWGVACPISFRETVRRSQRCVCVRGCVCVCAYLIKDWWSCIES